MTFVGWVEQRETRRLFPTNMMGFAALNPSYELAR